MRKNKIPAQLNRMKLSSQIEFFGDLFVEFSVERRLTFSSANKIFGTLEPVPEFDELVSHFRDWALAQYPASADPIDSALHDARIHHFDGKDEPGEVAARAAKFAREVQAAKAGWLQ